MSWKVSRKLAPRDIKIKMLNGSMETEKYISLVPKVRLHFDGFIQIESTLIS